MAPRHRYNRRRRGGSSSTSSYRSAQRSSTPAPRSVGVQRSLPPVSRAGPTRQVNFNLPHRSSRSSSAVSLRNAAPTNSGHGNLDHADTAAYDDDFHETIMAVDVRERGTVGCAYYIAAEEKLYFMEDVKLGGADIVEAREAALDAMSRHNCAEII